MSRFFFVYFIFTKFPFISPYGLSFEQYSDITILPSAVTLGENENLYLNWKPFNNSLSKCLVSSPGNVTYNLLVSSSNANVSSAGGSKKEGYCGFKVKSVKMSDSGIWQVNASSGRNLAYSITNITVLSLPVVTNQSQQFVEGKTVSFMCGSADALYCELLSPGGHKVIYNGPCDYKGGFAVVRIHQGIWKCQFALKGFVTLFSANYTINVVADTYREVQLEDFSDYVAVFCNIPKEQKYLYYCRVRTPLGTEMYLGPGKSYGRYIYYGNKPSECGVRIPKPLLKEDQGSWKCEIAGSKSSYNDHRGGYITVGTDNKNNLKVYTEKKIFWTKTDSSTKRLVCHVDYSIEYCWFKHPNGTIYHIRDQSIPPTTSQIPLQRFKFGDCGIEVEKDLINSTGVWSCHIGVNSNEVVELHADISVTFAETVLIQTDRLLGTPLGETTSIGCRAATRDPLHYCRFIRPDGVGLTVNENRNDSSYSYFGEGLLFGYCGLTIHQVTSHDIGTWICAAKLKGSSDDLIVKIKVEKINKAGAWVYLGVTLISVVTLSGVTYSGLLLYKKFKGVRQREDETQLHAEQEEEEEEVMESEVSAMNRLRRRSPRRPELLPSSNYF